MNRQFAHVCLKCEDPLLTADPSANQTLSVLRLLFALIRNATTLALTPADLKLFAKYQTMLCIALVQTDSPEIHSLCVTEPSNVRTVGKATFEAILSKLLLNVFIFLMNFCFHQ